MSEVQAVTGLQRRIRRLQTLRTLAAGALAVSAFIAGWTLTIAPAVAYAAAALVLFAVPLIVAGTYLIVRLRAEVKAAAGPAERPQAHAETVAEAVEALRQRQWEAITRQAYRAQPPDPGRLAASAGTALGEALSPSMAGVALGMARLAAATGGCAHPDAEPVDLLLTGERVAWVCPDCPAELLAGWRS